MRRNVIRLLVLGLMAPIAVFTTGCPQGSGEQISVSPSLLDFETDKTSLSFSVDNPGQFFSTAQFNVVAQNVPWIVSIEPTSGQVFNLFTTTPVQVTVTIDRNALAPGVVNTGIILVGPQSDQSSATTQTVTVRATGEGVVEGEGEGIIEGGDEGEGEGVIEGEGEGDDTCAPLECPIPCETVCAHAPVQSDVQQRLQELLALPVLGQDPNTADLDNNGILDIAHANLLDIVLANEDLPIHCCVFAAWDTNFTLVNDALNEYEAGLEGEDENIVDVVGRDVLQAVFTGLSTLGECRTQTVLENIVTTLGIPLDPSAFDLSARMYLASDGDADLDGVCNLAEFRGANSDPFGFILAAIDPQTTINGGGCGLPCYEPSGEGEGGEGGIEGGQEGDDEGLAPGELCKVALSQGAVVPPSGVSASGKATFSEFNDQVLLVVEHTVADATNIGVYVGSPGTNGNIFIALPSANSPTFTLLTPSQYAFISTDAYVQINSTSRPNGALRGNLQCVPGEGEGVVEGSPEGTPEGEGTADGEGVAEGVEEGEGDFGPHPSTHSADYLAPFNRITLSEVIRAIQFFNAGVGKGVLTGAYGCASDNTDEGYVPGGSLHNCRPHDLDFAPQDWRITLNELMRLIQIYNFLSGEYYYCPATGEDDDFCLGTNPNP